MWSWHKGWKAHKMLFPASSVRTRLLACLLVTIELGVFFVEARNLVVRLQTR
jgi:hypothetical protein